MKAKIFAAFQLARALVREQFLLVLGLFILSCSVNLTGEDATQLMTPAQETERWITQLLLGVWDLGTSVLLFLVLSWGLPKVLKFKAKDLLAEPFASPYLSSFFAEYLRVLAQTLMWGLLLVIPGFIRYCRLIFVNLITLFSKSYREGNVDALELSEKLTGGRLLLIAGILIGTGLVDAGVEFLPEMVPDLHILPLRVLFAALSFLISVWSYSLIFLLFEEFMIDEEP